jgi:DNA polymerase-3 subunit delta'
MNGLTIDMGQQAPFSWQFEQWQRLSAQVKTDQLAHAFLFSGETGIGKRLFAFEFAQLLLCLEPSENRACGKCQNCNLGKNCQHPDLVIIESEEIGKSIKIDQIRELADFVNKTSHSGGNRVVIVNEAHELNVNSANALLKTLEEPGSDTYILLISNLPALLPATIRSRCQRIQFPMPTINQATTWLQGRLDSADVGPALRNSHGRPLLALHAAEQGVVENRQIFLTRFAEALGQPAGLQGLVALAVKIGEKEVLGYLATTSSILIKYLLTNSRPLEADSLIEDLKLRTGISGLATVSLVRRLLAFNGEIQKARRQLQGSTNPNSQLIMESLLWQWSRLVQTAV